MENAPQMDEDPSAETTPPQTFVTDADKKGIDRRSEIKKKFTSFFITNTDAEGNFRIREETLRPKPIDLRPKSPAQILLFEIPLLLHLPFFFLIELTTAQTLELTKSVGITFLISIIAIILLNRITIAKNKILMGIIILLFTIINIYLLSQVFVLIAGEGWFFNRYPVFERLFS
jgi:hypothetical protein